MDLFGFEAEPSIPEPPSCYFFNDKNERLMLPIQTTHYDVRIQNNFA